ncbi:hypothetical protein [Hymenobacter arizonensis]|uniref:BNR/Asp-box repeat-containing protein n=1 Tax=Hymenobacter arizonensis TaxID=1227077 RepID=A0A1I5XXT9_HYMAR|nr:hypothetical protein [Hymenobacter arizonensis]SFQ36768.1 hypothetical protein SAMN04515668_2108 [Hymenobacter arizonensis]
MKPYVLLLATGLLAAACQKKDIGLATREAEDPDWIKLELPATIYSDDIGDMASAVVGDLDKTLLVANMTQVFSTLDQGKTWQAVRNFDRQVGLLARNDTIFALVAYGLNGQGEKIAGNADVYTTDFGKTWAYTGLLPRGYQRYSGIVRPLGQVEAGGISYRVQENTRPIPNSTSRLVLAGDLLRTAGSSQSTLRLPARHYLNNLHLDTQNRLYVAVSGLRFDAVTGDPITKKGNQRATVYVSRKPLP